MHDNYLSAQKWITHVTIVCWLVHAHQTLLASTTIENKKISKYVYLFSIVEANKVWSIVFILFYFILYYYFWFYLFFYLFILFYIYFNWKKLVKITFNSFIKLFALLNINSQWALDDNKSNVHVNISLIFADNDNGTDILYPGS